MSQASLVSQAGVSPGVAYCVPATVTAGEPGPARGGHLRDRRLGRRCLRGVAGGGAWAGGDGPRLRGRVGDGRLSGLPLAPGSPGAEWSLKATW